MKAYIISIGTELTMGELVDTNAPYIASKLPQRGINLLGISQVGDDIDGESVSDGSGYAVSLSSDGDTVAIGAIGNENFLWISTPYLFLLFL